MRRYAYVHLGKVLIVSKWADHTEYYYIKKCKEVKKKNGKNRF